MSDLLSDIIQRSTAVSEPATHLALLRHFTLLVNKFLFKTDLEIANEKLSTLLPPGAGDQKINPTAIKAIFWLSKALVLRLAPSTAEILTSLLSLLSSSDETTSTTAARGFTVLLSDDEVLSPTNGANVRLLSKQRVFTTVVPLISSRIRHVNIAGNDTTTTTISSPTTTNNQLPAHIKPAHLTALSGILSTIPPSLVMPELPTLLPLLLQSLDLQTTDSQGIRAATLETLAVIIRDNGVTVIDECGHVQSLVTRLLNTAAYIPISQPTPIPPTTTATGEAGERKPTNTTLLRTEALKCLFLLAHTPNTDAPAIARAGKLSPLLPVKGQVLRALRMVLDDPKRDVRKAAVDARGAWLRGVDDESEEDD